MFLIRIFCLFALFYNVIYGWHDEAHMLIVAIAKLQLTSSEIEILERPLKFLSATYPEFSNLITASTWADSIKTHDDFVVLNSWHYISLVWNPSNIQLSDYDKVMPYPGTGAVFALSTLFSEEIPFLLKRLNEYTEWNYTTPSKEYGAVHIPFNPLVFHWSNKSLNWWTWNIKLRYLIHVFGDLHQPLHAIEMFSSQYPNGTEGGGRIPVNYENKSFDVHTLHELWDSCGDIYNKRSYQIKEDYLIALAKTLIKEHPYSNDDVNSFEAVAKDSYNIGRAFVYQEFLLEDPYDPHISLPYVPSAGYIHQVRSICKKRLVFAGFRLSKILKDISCLLKDAVWENQSNSISVSSYNEKNSYLTVFK